MAFKHHDWLSRRFVTNRASRAAASERCFHLHLLVFCWSLVEKTSVPLRFQSPDVITVLWVPKTDRRNVEGLSSYPTCIVRGEERHYVADVGRCSGTTERCHGGD